AVRRRARADRGRGGCAHEVRARVRARAAACVAREAGRRLVRGVARCRSTGSIRRAAWTGTGSRRSIVPRRIEGSPVFPRLLPRPAPKLPPFKEVSDVLWTHDYRRRAIGVLAALGVLGAGITVTRAGGLRHLVEAVVPTAQSPYDLAQTENTAGRR